MYKVIKPFTDKHTKTKYKVGDEKNFTEKRAKEILLVGNLIEKIEVEETIEVDEEVKPKKKRKK